MINTHDGEQLQTHFKANIRNSRLRWLVSASDNLPNDADIGPVKVGLIKKFIAGVSWFNVNWKVGGAELAG